MLLITQRYYGILGIGKSRLTFELIQKVIYDTDTKIICIDITNQYLKEIVSYIDKSLVINDLSILTKKALKHKSSNSGASNQPNQWGNENFYQKKVKKRLQAFDRSKGKVLILNPDWHKVNKARSTFNIVYADDLTIAEKTRIIAEQVFMYAMSQGETDKARFLLVFEEAALLNTRVEFYSKSRRPISK